MINICTVIKTEQDKNQQHKILVKKSKEQNQKENADRIIKQLLYMNTFLMINFEMLVSALERPHCQSVRQRRSQSALAEDIQSDAKAYRNILSVFTDNFNAMIRSNRDCLFDLQAMPKIKISREQQQSIIDLLDKLFPKLSDKLSKQAFYRNINVRRTYQQYYNLYKQYQPEIISDEYQTNDQTIEETINTQRNQQNSVQEQKNDKLVRNATTRRPMSSKGGGTAGLRSLNQALNSFNTSTIAQIYKMKTISAQVNQNPEKKNDKSFVVSLQRRILREQSFSSKKSMYAKQKQLKDENRYTKKMEEDGFIFNGSQIMISDHKPFFSTNQSVQNKKSPSIFQSTKFCSKRMTGLNYAQRKSIDQIERMQIQNRIMMVNSVLSVNLAQSQGYRPKTKCWQNYFNQ